MKVDGQYSANFFGFFGKTREEHKEATVSREHSAGGIFEVAKSRLTIDAGSGDDNISVKKTGPNAYEVDINGQKFVLSKKEMEGLTIRGGSGNDNIFIDASVDIPIIVHGDSGNDTITNRASYARIYGGSGNDAIGSSGDGVKIYGGTGDDVLGSVGDNCVVFGERGSDTIGVSGDYNLVRGHGSFDLFDLIFPASNSDDITVNGDENNVSFD